MDSKAAVNSGIERIQRLSKEIESLKKEKQAVILGHNYQRIEVQAIADELGDSLGLSQIAKNITDAEIIVFAGVFFMAETAKILNPTTKVLIPAENAWCSLADNCSAEIVNEYREKYGEDIPVVVYVNTTAETKAAADVTCTSSNAVTVVKNLKADKVLFGPDRNLTHFVQEQLPDIELIPLPDEGYCHVHRKFDVETIKEIKQKYPDAKVMAHPECNVDVQHYSDYVGSTSGMFRYGQESETKTFIVATEKGLIDRMNKEIPKKHFIHAKSSAICEGMKEITLENIKEALEKEQYKVTIPKDIRLKAKEAIDRMLELT
jgi:quinolinate synthase